MASVAPSAVYSVTPWEISFLDPLRQSRNALIILNQPFSFPLLRRLWYSSAWHACADGGANRLHDLLKDHDGKDIRHLYTPDLIKGDLDSLRVDVQLYYASRGVRIVRDEDQYATDLMKCIASLVDDEKAERHVEQHTIVILGGLSGRLDQTVHTLSLLHKLRRSRQRVFVITDDSVAWLLDAGEHRIAVDHTAFGPTCGLLPLGVDSTVLTTTGLKWNLTDQISSFDGLISTSNHLLPEEPVVTVKTTKPLWWTMELRPLA
ncbi:thiamine pyrophosphokinase [Dichomitus squalens]|uniref:Thiamine pyrophosphokinase n=1 Tax=Dichomitus squalens TaxID=114155 RepID=A0A4V2K999_9APHY|nr:thiamine pyrophosphokinase [Dichomitus squalens]TBU49851.1 thiamine pyrophosphokinase [Dichomitus squalens]TBU63078.1 thiamine pyrophosphokinase [Dichomitus squalens]